MFFTYIVILYTINVKPFTLKLANYMEIVNELTILGLSYMTFCFSDFIPNIRTKNEIGLAYSVVILLSVIVNILGIIIASFVIPFIKRTKKNY